MSTESKTIAVHTATVKNKSLHLRYIDSADASRGIALAVHDFRSFLPSHQALMQHFTTISAHLSHRQSRTEETGPSRVSKGESAGSRREVRISTFPRGARLAPSSTKGQQVGPHLFLPDASREGEYQSKLQHVSVLMIYRVRYYSEDSQTAFPFTHVFPAITVRWSGESVREGRDDDRFSFAGTGDSEGFFPLAIRDDWNSLS